MRKTIGFVSALLAALMLAGCGGGGAGDQSPKIKFSSAVYFGDSLSDVGSYAVPTITAYGGGGQYTINGGGKNWTELVSAQLGLAAPCAYETGLNGSVFGAGVTIATHAGCTNYAQGGARVTIPYGPGNATLATLFPTNTTFADYALLGQLTVPITTQMDNHIGTLTSTGGKFSGNEVVFVLAGANDILMQFGTYGASVTADPTNAATYATDAVTATGAAATDLVGYIDTKLIANGAKYVVVLNVPDIANTPFAISNGAAAKDFIDTLVTTYNGILKAGLANNANVLFIDAYSANRDEVTNPTAYGLTNVDTPACDLTAATNPLGSSLMCNTSNLISGVTADTHYLFADDVHPTPYGYLQLARLVSKEMLIKGWM